jgi:hypothetical protein
MDHRYSFSDHFAVITQRSELRNDYAVLRSVTHVTQCYAQGNLLMFCLQGAVAPRRQRGEQQA